MIFAADLSQRAGCRSDRCSHDSNALLSAYVLLSHNWSLWSEANHPEPPALKSSFRNVRLLVGDPAMVVSSGLNQIHMPTTTPHRPAI